MPWHLQLARDPDPTELRAALFGHLLNAVRRDDEYAERITEELRRMTWEGLAPSEETESDMWYFESALHLCRAVYGNRDSVLAELKAFLATHAAATQQGTAAVRGGIDGYASLVWGRAAQKNSEP